MKRPGPAEQKQRARNYTEKIAFTSNTDEGPIGAGETHTKPEDKNDALNDLIDELSKNEETMHATKAVNKSQNKKAPTQKAGDVKEK